MSVVKSKVYRYIEGNQGSLAELCLKDSEEYGVMSSCVVCGSDCQWEIGGVLAEDDCLLWLVVNGGVEMIPFCSDECAAQHRGCGERACVHRRKAAEETSKVA